MMTRRMRVQMELQTLHSEQQLLIPPRLQACKACRQGTVNGRSV